MDTTVLIILPAECLLARVRGITVSTVDVGTMAVGRASTVAIGAEVGTGMKADSAIAANSMVKADGIVMVDSTGTRASTANVNSMEKAVSAAGTDLTAAATGEVSTVEAASMAVADLTGEVTGSC
jgi:hypothetical protein